MSKHITLENLQTFLDEFDDRYVPKKTGYGLSSNDFEDVYKERIKSIEDGAEPNKIVGIKMNSTFVKPDKDRVVDLKLPAATKDDIDEVLGIKGEVVDDEDSQYATVRDIQNLFAGE